MIEFNEEELKAAIVTKAVDEILDIDSDISALITKEVRARLDKIFAERANAQIESAIVGAIDGALEHEYLKLNAWGEKDGPATTIKKELEKVATGYWTARVDNKTGKPSDSTYSSITRAQYVMTQVCAEDFQKHMKQNALSITGALKDGFRNQMAQQMDKILDELFRVRSLQDQGKVQKPY